MKKIIVISLCIVIIAFMFLVTGCSSNGTTVTVTQNASSSVNASPAATETFELKFADPYSEQDDMSIGAKYLFDQMEKRTGGRVKITPYWSGSLGALPDELDMLDNGTADLALFPPSLFPKVFQVWDAVTLPGVKIPNASIATEAAYSLYYTGYMEKDFVGYKPILFEGTDPMIFFFNQKVTSLEELAKLKIRAPAGTVVDTAKALGTSVVTISPSDLYVSLDRGVADGLMSMSGSYLSLKLNEICKEVLWLPMGCGANIIVMSQQRWDSLPNDIKLIFDQVMIEAKYYYLDEIQRRVPDRVAQLKSLGLDVYTLSPDEQARWYAAVQPVTDKWIADKTAAGLPAQNIVDEMNKIVTRFLQQ